MPPCPSLPVPGDSTGIGGTGSPTGCDLAKFSVHKTINDVDGIVTSFILQMTSTIEDHPTALGIRDASTHCLASLVFLVWDILISYEAEVEHIWPKPRTSAFKWLYLYLRYFNLLVQIWNQIAVSHLTNGEDHASLCGAWYIYAAVVSQVSVSAVEVILAIRIFALFNKSYRIACLLAFVLTAEMLTMAVNNCYTIPKIRPSEACIVAELPEQVLGYSSVLLITQSVLVGLMIFKHTTVLRSGWGRTPLVSVLVRDGSVVYIIVLVFAVALIASSKLQDKRTIAMFLSVGFWGVSVSSVAGCRLIINTQKLVPAAAQRKRPRSEVAIFTSEIDVTYHVA
ncbi:hypothetical protein BU15DRAFT_75255 [Melanogaster broomeanus]|nr:hypothetical protein BU15DRAFT_75255 [Melanogaster broomeanus]